MLSAGIKAPDFTLKDKDGKEVKLSSFLGRKVVLYFYPKDNTPGCTREACAFAGAYIGFKQRNVEVIGVSRDSEKSHANFAAKHELPFILLSDPELTAIQAYDVWKEKNMSGKKTMSAQAVGGAVGHNPISILIPCHRVVGTNSSLTGYAGGIEKKIGLLKLERTDMSGMFVPKKGTAL